MQSELLENQSPKPHMLRANYPAMHLIRFLSITNDCCDDVEKHGGIWLQNKDALQVAIKRCDWDYGGPSMRMR
jgi:hypothetical protein